MYILEQLVHNMNCSHHLWVNNLSFCLSPHMSLTQALRCCRELKEQGRYQAVYILEQLVHNMNCSHTCGSTICPFVISTHVTDTGIAVLQGAEGARQVPGGVHPGAAGAQHELQPPPVGQQAR